MGLGGVAIAVPHYVIHPKTVVLGRAGGGKKRKVFEKVLQKGCSVICLWHHSLMRKRGNFAVSKRKRNEQILFIIGEGAC